MDTIANILSTIKNSAMAGRKFTEVPYSKVSEEVLKVLKEKGFLENVKVFKPEGSHFKMMHVDLVYEGGVSKISNIIRISKPGKRVYKGKKELRRVVSGFGISVVSTSQGIMESMEAKKRKLGGEEICKVF